MNARARTPRRRGPHATADGNVFDLDRHRIVQALARRERYKYVKPGVVREGAGWKVVSPNCSRSIDPEGGVIDIAWLLPDGAGTWSLHARDHAQGRWVPKAQALTLPAALDTLCTDPLREFWQ